LQTLCSNESCRQAIATFTTFYQAVTTLYANSATSLVLRRISADIATKK
jgi:hypothetical protein